MGANCTKSQPNEIGDIERRKKPVKGKKFDEDELDNTYTKTSESTSKSKNNASEEELE